MKCNNTLFCISADSLTFLKERGQPATGIKHCWGTTLWSCQSSDASSWEKWAIPSSKRGNLWLLATAETKHRSILTQLKFWKMPFVRTKCGSDSGGHGVFLKFPFEHSSNHSSKCSRFYLVNKLLITCTINIMHFLHNHFFKSQDSEHGKAFTGNPENTRWSWQKTLHKVCWFQGTENSFQSTVRGRRDKL